MSNPIQKPARPRSGQSRAAQRRAARASSEAPRTHGKKQINRLVGLVKSPWNALLALATLFGAVFAVWIVLQPGCDVTVADAPSGKLPTPAVFLVKNTGGCGLKDMSVRSRVDDMQTGQVHITELDVVDITNPIFPTHVAYLKPGQSFPCRFMGDAITPYVQKAGISSATGSIIVSYTPARWGSKRRIETFRFFATQVIDGQLHWYREPT